MAPVYYYLNHPAFHLLLSGNYDLLPEGPGASIETGIAKKTAAFCCCEN